MEFHFSHHENQNDFNNKLISNNMHGAEIEKLLLLYDIIRGNRHRW